MRRRPFIATLAGAIGAAAGSVVSLEPRGDAIEILTDDYGVSHVYADDLYELGYGNGYVQARDRLFQLDALRLVGRGESATLQGPGQLSSDVQVTRDLYDRAARTEQWERADEEIREAIEGFTDGVNERLEAVRDTRDMPGEFAFLGRDPEPWEPQDTIAVVNYTIGFFGVGGGSELANAQRFAAMVERMDDEAAAWRAYGDLNSRVVPEEHTGSLTAAEIDPTDERALAYEEVPEDQLEAIRAAADAEPWGVQELDLLEAVKHGLREAVGVTSGGEFGSNAIIVGGDLTDTGRPMLAGGPQMGLFKPPVVHEIGLHGDGFDAAGVGVVGTPAIVVGRTQEFAWTVTTSGDDMVDTVAVELDPEDRYRYRWDGEYHEMRTEEVVHEANLFAGLLEGELEPATVLQEVALIEQEGTELPVIAWNEDENLAYCQRVTTRKQELDGVFRWAEIARADGLEDIEALLAEFPFGFNFHVVDDEQIAYYRTGTLPDRADDVDPRFPAPAERHRWDGLEVGTEIGASAVEPERGYVVNWNNAPAPGWGHSDAEVQWGSLHRVDVMERLTQEAIERTDGTLTLADVEGIIEDCAVEHPFAPRSVPHLVEAGLTSNDEQLHQMARELMRWAERDYAFRPGEDGRYPDGGMAIWESCRHALQDLVFGDELGEATPDLTFDPGAGDGLGDDVDPHAADHGGTNTWDLPLVDALEGTTDHQWLPPAESQHETRRLAVCRAALRRAGQELEERFESPDPSEWRLAARESEFTPLGAGASSAVPMSNRATYQQAIAMRESGADAGSVLPPSNTGQLRFGELLGVQLLDTEPDRLTDQLELYAEFGYKPHPVTREEVERHATDSRGLDP